MVTCISSCIDHFLFKIDCESDFRHWTNQHLLSDNELLNVSETSRFRVLQNPGAVTVCVLHLSWLDILHIVYFSVSFFIE